MVDDEDYELLNQWRWNITKKEKDHTYYVRRTINSERRTVLMHRLILNAGPMELVDHKDHNGLNNTRSNIRIATYSQNSANQKAKYNSTSKYIGVKRKKVYSRSRHKYWEYWEAYIQSDGKWLFLGTHKTEDDAAIAYNKKASELRGEFAVLNVILDSR